MKENAGTGQGIRLEPAWKKSASSSYRKEYVQHDSNGVTKKKLNSLVLDVQVLLCKPCGS